MKTLNTDKRLIANDDFFQAVEETLDSGYQVKFTVTGNSMWPFLAHGRDTVIIEKCTADTLKKGDIILFSPMPSKYILHRIYEINANGFETVGDRNCFKDGVFPLTCIKARVKTIIRRGKEIPINSLSLRFISSLWTLLFPFRKPLISFLFLLIKIKNIFKDETVC